MTADATTKRLHAITKRLRAIDRALNPGVGTWATDAMLVKDLCKTKIAATELIHALIEDLPRIADG